MAFGITKTKLSPIAIDFGADSIKMLQIVPTNPPQLVAAACAPIPDHARQDPVARMAFITEALKNLLATQPFKGKRVMLSIPAFQTIVQHMEVAAGHGENIELELGLNLQQRLGINPSRMIIRHFPVTKIMRNGATQQELICIAAMRDVIMQYIDLVAKCKLDVVGMHSEPVCTLKAVEQMAGMTDDQHAVCYIDIGSAMTKVNIAHGSQLVFAKSIHAAGDHLTKQLATQKRIAFSDARQARIAHSRGIDLESAVHNVAASTEMGPATAVATQSVIPMSKPTSKPFGSKDIEESLGKETLECLIDELHMCFRHYKTLFPENQIQKLVFMGGESNNTKTCQRIAKSVQIAAQLGDPFARLTRIGQKKAPVGVDLDQAQPGWVVPLGLCLCEANL